MNKSDVWFEIEIRMGMRFEGGEVEGERGLQPRSEIRMRVGSKGSEVRERMR